MTRDENLKIFNLNYLTYLNHLNHSKNLLIFNSINSLHYATEISRLKTYYAGLEAAQHLDIPQSLRDEMAEDLADPETEDYYRESITFAFSVYLPVCNVMRYIVNNRILCEDIPDIVDSIDECTPQLPPEEIYKALQSVAPFAVAEYIRTIPCPSNVLERLLQSFQDADCDTFVSLIKDNPCDLRPISVICSQLWPDVQPLLGLDVDEQLLVADTQTHRSRYGLEQDDVAIYDAGDRMYASMLRTEEDLNDETLEQYFEDYYRYLNVHLAAVLHLYWDDYDRFKQRERALLERLLLRPEYADTYKRLLHEYQYGDTFALPNDYFSRLSAVGTQLSEFMNPNPIVVKAGPEKFTQLVEYLAQQGYIADTPGEKYLFAYRFSGRMRPETLHPIVWHGKNNKPYELIYLVRNLTERGNYKKMRAFFTGPQWVKNNDSSYAIGASYQLKKFLYDLYPDLPNQL